MLKRKKLFFVPLVFVAVLAISGCRQSGNQNTSKNSTAANQPNTAPKEVAPTSNNNPAEAPEVINNISKDLKSLDESTSGLDENISL